MRRTILATHVAGLLLCGSGTAFAAMPPVGQSADAATQVRVTVDYGKLPMSFEANHGQADRAARFIARGQDYGLFLTSTEAVLTLRGSALISSRQANAVIRVRLAGANPKPQLSGIDPLPGSSNYFIGNDPAHWRTAVPNYAKVKYAQVYPGIDLVYYGHQRQFEYDFIVSPGADPKRIMLDFRGVKKLALDSAGNLLLTTGTGDLVQRKPVVYQYVDGVRYAIDGHYRLHGKRRVSFEVAHYDTKRTLVIDPTLAYSSYLGGAGDDGGISIAVDGSGNAYVTGSTSGDFPTTPGAYQTTSGGGAFVTKLNATGTALVYSTYLGGPGGGTGIAVDGSGNAYVTGFAACPAGYTNCFPTTPGAYQSTFGGDRDAFVTKLNVTGTELVYSTYLGGAGLDHSTGIAVDGSGNAYVTGFTNGGFPTTPGAYQSTPPGGDNDAFVTKLNATGSALVYSTYVGGPGIDSAQGIAADGSGNAYVTGAAQSGFPTTPGAYQAACGFECPFVTKLNATGTALAYSTFLGGLNLASGAGVAVDGGGHAYVTGETLGFFPTTPGAFQTTYGGGPRDAFVTKLNANGTALVYSTYLGGTGSDSGLGIALDGNGNAYVVGWTNGSFPTTSGAYQTTSSGNADVFMTKLNNAGTALVYSTFLGGSSSDFGFGIAVDGGGNAYVTGYVHGDFPTTPGAYQTTYGGGSADAFVALFAEVLPGVRIVVPDGTSLQQSFSSYPETRWFAMTVEPGKTYVVETTDTDGDLLANAIGALQVFDPDAVSPAGEASVDCTSGPRPPAIDVASDGVRCVIRTLPPSSARLNKRPVYLKVTRMDPATGGGSQFKIRAREATIYGRWLTAGFDFHVEIENTSGYAMCVEVARYPASGLVWAPGPGWSGPLATFTLTVPAFGAVKQVIPKGSLVGADSEGTLRISACASPTSLIPGGLHVSTYAFDTVGNRYIYFFSSTANEGKTRSTW